MRGRISRYGVRLNRKPRKRLEALVRRRSEQHAMVIRAKIVLASADGLTIRQICQRYTLDHQVVRRWIKVGIPWTASGHERSSHADS